jgi:outer membrane lipoprotein-sorting protein
LSAEEQLAPDTLLSKAIESFQNLNSYQCRMVVHLTKGKETQDSQYLFSYQKPRLMRMYVEKGKDKKSTVILREDGIIRGKPGGMLSVVPPLTLKPDDKRLRDIWDRRFYQANWGTLLKEIQNSLKGCASAKIEMLNSGKEYLLTVQGSNGDVDQIWFHHEHLSLFKRKVRLASGDELDAKWTDIKLNPAFADKFFDF